MESLHPVLPEIDKSLAAFCNNSGENGLLKITTSRPLLCA